MKRIARHNSCKNGRNGKRVNDYFNRRSRQSNKDNDRSKQRIKKYAKFTRKNMSGRNAQKVDTARTKGQQRLQRQEEQVRIQPLQE